MGVKGASNILDMFICFIWVILAALRIGFIISRVSFNIEDVTAAQQVYIFGFGIQIILLTLRGLSLFSNTIYIGTLLRVIKLMFIEILKFLSIFVIVMFGFVFGLWLINAANACEGPDADCSDYELGTIRDAIIYVFQVFIPSQLYSR